MTIKADIENKSVRNHTHVIGSIQVSFEMYICTLQLRTYLNSTHLRHFNINTVLTSNIIFSFYQAHRKAIFAGAGVTTLIVITHGVGITFIGTAQTLVNVFALLRSLGVALVADKTKAIGSALAVHALRVRRAATIVDKTWVWHWG